MRGKALLKTMKICEKNIGAGCPVYVVAELSGNHNGSLERTKEGVDAVRAEVFQSNLASQSAFEKTGFEWIETCEIKNVPSYVFLKKRSPFAFES